MHEQVAKSLVYALAGGSTCMSVNLWKGNSPFHWKWIFVNMRGFQSIARITYIQTDYNSTWKYRICLCRVPSGFPESNSMIFPWFSRTLSPFSMISAKLIWTNFNTYKIPYCLFKVVSILPFYSNIKVQGLKIPVSSPLCIFSNGHQPLSPPSHVL